MEATHGHGDSHEHPEVPYFLIFGTLLVLTVVTIAVAKYVNLGKAGNVGLALAIASFKASMVMLFFMHIKYERRTLVMVALSPFVLSAVLWLALFPDVVFGQFPTKEASEKNPPAAAKTEHH